MMTNTLEQKIADTEARLARLRQQGRKLDNGQKIIVGGLLINAARNEPRIRKWLLDETAKSVTRDVDKKRLAPLLDELAKMPKETP
jgi:hypothetical protein